MTIAFQQSILIRSNVEHFNIINTETNFKNNEN